MHNLEKKILSFPKVTTNCNEFKSFSFSDVIVVLDLATDKNVRFLLVL